MSLRVWLPLNGTLDNQGLDDVVVTNNGATVDNNGKIGKCYSFNGSSNYLNFNEKAITSTFYSISFWIKVSNISGNKCIICCRSASNHAFAIYLIGAVLRIDTGSNWSTGYKLTANNWYHVAFTTDGTIQNLYINGLQVVTRTSSTSINQITSFCTIGAEHTNGSNIGVYFNGSLNDIRVYDHCLSPMEVKKISQGLILHYPLNRNGWGQENLIRNTDFGGISQKYTVTSGTEGGFIYTPTETIVANTEYIVSCRLRGNANMNLYKLCTGGNEALNWVNRSRLSTTEYRPFSIVFTCPSNKTLNKIYICTRYGTASTSTGDWFEIEPCSLKLEKGSIATPWCPNSSDILITTMGLNNNIQYDTNGYGNNGTKTGTFSYSSDTPKYNVSTIFNGSNYIEAEPLPNETKTISVWVNYQTLPTGSDYSGFIMFDKNTQISICVYNGGQYLIPYIGSSKGGTGSRVITSFQTNKWYHIVVLKTGATTREVYINGVKATPSGTNYWSGDLNKLLIGIRHASGAYKDGAHAKICDFRAYTTLLSPQDILSLYNNEAYIDNNGNIYGAMYEEV